MKTILIVEDNPANMKLFRMILRSFPYTIIEAWDGQSGIEIACSAKPDLILMDIQLPILDGIQAFHKIRTNPLTHSIPIIALTSYAMKDDEKKLLGMGFDAYLAKPMLKAVFLQKIAQFL